MSDVLTPISLVVYLRSLHLRSRTGILLLHQSHLGKEEAIAVQLGIEALNYSALLLESLPEKTDYVTITSVTEEARLFEIAQRRSGMEVVLIYNFDLVLSKLTLDERSRLWENLRERFAKSAKALLFAVPAAATHLLPQGAEWHLWEEGNRIVGMN